jgi:hypothetical protein
LGEREDVRLFIGEKLTEGEDEYKLVAVNSLFDAVDNEVGVVESDDNNDVDDELETDAIRVTLGLFDTVNVRIPVFVFIDEIVLSRDCVSIVDDVRIAVLVDETEIEAEYEEELVVEYVKRGVIELEFNGEPVSNIDGEGVNEKSIDSVPKKFVFVAAFDSVLPIVFELVAD